ncbi:hypothetical protein [Mycobacterium sp. 852002-53434_SCH5985345]|uniref:hypothetical protein n=1 Tax=Mycobacterium sp. 852002-53434_SCH5985345 TaxID=1834107 RepID=UPI000A89112A|nr:hypothetical protein [Mycobacterium sp. 852002-53434_SCH5985345]
MELLKVGDRVITVSGSPGSVVEVNDTNARVEFDDGKPSGWYGRDEHHFDGGVLKLL